MSAITTRSVLWILRATILAAAIAQFVLFAVFLDQTMILRPFADMISYIDAHLQARQHGDVLGYLWAPHAQHHLVFVRVLTALDVAAFRASGVPFVVATTIAATVTASIIYVEFRRDKLLTGPMHALAWLGPMLLLNTAAAIDCSVPINCIYPLTLVFLVATLVLLASGAEGGPYTVAKRTAALATAVLASFGSAVGLVIWPAMLWLAWRSGASKRWLIAIGALGTGYVLLYILTLPSADLERPSRFLEIEHVLKIADYLLAYLGLPLSPGRFPELGPIARALGGVLLAAAIIAILYDAILRRPATRLHLIGVGLIMVALAIAFMAALGRVDEEQEVTVPVRYAVFVAPLHIGLLALVLPVFAGAAVTPQRQIALLSAGTALAGVLLLMQIVPGSNAISTYRSVASSIDHYEQSRVIERGREYLFPDPALADRVLTELRNEGR